jgi:hypothetical protein
MWSWLAVQGASEASAALRDPDVWCRLDSWLPQCHTLLDLQTPLHPTPPPNPLPFKTTPAWPPELQQGLQLEPGQLPEPCRLLLFGVIQSTHITTHPPPKTPSSHHPQGFNKIYNWNLASSLKKIFLKHQPLWRTYQGPGQPERVPHVNTIREFDEAITVHSFGECGVR